MEEDEGEGGFKLLTTHDSRLTVFTRFTIHSISRIDRHAVERHHVNMKTSDLPNQHLVFPEGVILIRHSRMSLSGI